MHILYKKGEKMSISTLVSLIIFAIVIVVIIGFLIQSSEMLNQEVTSNFGCWLSNGIKGGGGIFITFPSACVLQEYENTDTETIATMITTTWWMYHKGELDYGSTFDEMFPAYAFTVSEEIALQDLIIYMATHRNGKEVDLEDSDYNYLQSGGSKTQALCFYTQSFDSKFVFYPGQTYYISFFDTQSVPLLEGWFDRVVVAHKSGGVSPDAYADLNAFCIPIATPTGGTS